MIVTIDGPAGAGKSTVSRQLAGRLNFRYLDTGAMYRAVALAALRRGLSGEDATAIERVAKDIELRFDNERVLLDGDDVTDEIRTPDVTAVIHWAADNPQVRDRLVQLQRQEAAGGNIVCDGRDQGTVAFPDAECKIFLTASAAERARRRVADFAQRGQQALFDDVLTEQNDRDRRDESRPVGALRKAADAVEVNTDGMSENEVVDRLEEIVRSKMED